MSRLQWTKQLVDNHVQNALKQLKDDKERKMRGFQFAKMYFDVKEYETARRYLSGFLTIRDNMPSAYKLLGETLEMLHQDEQALDAYKRSFDLDHNQNGVLLKVCQLFSQSSKLSPEMARYWVEKAEKVFPGHDIVFKLKLKASETSENSSDAQQDLLCLLVSEADKFPHDVNRQVRLVRQYADMNRINDAYVRAINVDTSLSPNFSTSIEWQRCLCDVFKKYKDEMGTNVNGTFHQHYLSALNSLTALSTEKSSITESLDALWRFDQVLVIASEIANQRDDWKVFCREMEAQFFFHCGTIILNKALKERLNWREACELSTACYIASYSVAQPSTKSAWFAKAKDSERKIYAEWVKLACYRCSQTGHMLINLAPQGTVREWMERIFEDYSVQQGKDKLFKLLFTSPQQKDNCSSSFLLQNTLFTTLTPRFPDAAELKEVDREAQQLRLESLHHAVWICLQYYTVKAKTQPNYELKLFEGLAYDATNLETAGPESLRHLDVEAFLYAVVRSEAVKQFARRTLLDDGRPTMLPASVCEPLCSSEQQDWWYSVYKLTSNSARESLGQARAVLQRGLETVRLIGGSSLDVDLTVHLARTFAEKADMEEMEDRAQLGDNLNSEIRLLQARARHYWTKAIEKLERIEQKRGIRAAKYNLFENRDNQLSQADVRAYLDEGRLYLAKMLTAQGNYSEALNLLNQIQSAEASFQTALVYKSCALHEVGQLAGDDTVTDTREMMLMKAKDALCLTLDRLRGDRFHALNRNVTEEMEIIESYMAATENGDNAYAESYFDDNGPLSQPNLGSLLTPDKSFAPRSVRGKDRAFGCFSDANVAQSTPQCRKTLSSTSPMTSGHRCRPSPDRLDAEIRSLRFTQDNMLKTLADEMKQIWKTVEQTQSVVQQSAERLTNIESKMTVMLEFQRQQMLMTRPIIPTGPLPNRTSVVPPPPCSSTHLNDNGPYDYSATSAYDPAYFAQHFGHPIAPPAPQTTCYPAFQGGIQQGYLLPTSVPEQPGRTDEYDFHSEHYGYNEDDYAENALSYEIQDPLIPLVTREMYDGALGTVAQPVQILPGFFTTSVRQSLSDKVVSMVSMTESSTVNITAPSSTVNSQVVPDAGCIKTLDLRSSKPDVIANPPSSVHSTSVPSSVTTTDDDDADGNANVTASVLPAVTSSASAPQKPVLFAPKFIASPPATLMSTPVTTCAVTKSDVRAPSAQAEGTKTVFGGISFLNTPLAAVQKEGSKTANEETEKASAKPANPFANFQFNFQPAAKTSEKKDVEKGDAKPAFGGLAAVTSSCPPAVMKPAAFVTPGTKPGVAAGTPLFGSGSSSSAVSFAALAEKVGSDGKTPGFVRKPDSAAFQGAGQQLFKGTTSKSPASIGKSKSDANTSGTKQDEEEECGGEDYVPDQEFKPLVSLPEVEVKTGEENEEKLFSDRAKLYRMDTESKQWKERGIGEVKILCHRTTGLFRIVMRREQVLKLCANHYITASMRLMPMSSSETSLCWFAHDYSEEEMRKEQLCIKFKTVEQLQKFRKCFEDCQEKLLRSEADSSKLTVSTSIKAPSSSSDKPASKSTDKPLSSLFKSKPGEWQCTGCYLTNDANRTTCVACATLKPGTPQPAAAPVEPSQPPTSNLPSLSSQFQVKPGEWECTSCYVKNPPDKTACLACEAARPGVTGTSSSSASSQMPAKPVAVESAFKLAPSGGFSFGPAGGSSFSFAGFGSKSTPSSSVVPTQAVTSTSAAVFSAFSAQVTTVQQTKVTTVTSSTATPATGFVMPKFGTFKPTTTAAATTPLFTFGSSQSVLASASASISASASSSCIFSAGAQTKTTSAPVTISRPLPTFQSSASTPSFALLTPQSSSSAANVKTSESKPSFGSSSFVFQGIRPTASLTNLAGSGSPFRFPGFNTSTPTTQHEPAAARQQPASPCSPKSPDNELYENTVEDEPNVSFEPVVQLPDNVEVKTGEEDEDELYCHRAKLYRFADGEWKERGIGDVKLLRHHVTGVVRIIMRRERVLKICMNHRITSNLVLQPMPSSQGKAWTWHTNDFSDGTEPKFEKFSIRFKTEEIANEFKKAFDSARDACEASASGSSEQVQGAGRTTPGAGRSLLMELLTTTPSASNQDVQPSDDADDCVVVEVVLPSKELIAKAAEFQLSPPFYNYLSSPDCPGCIGCKSDKHSPEGHPCKSISKGTVSVSSDDTASAGTAKATTSVGTSSVPAFSVQPSAIFGTAASLSKPVEQKVFGSAAGLSKPGEQKNTMPAVFGSAATLGTAVSQSAFSSTASGSVFGSTSKTVGFADLAAAKDMSSFGKKSGETAFTWQNSGAQLFTQTTPKSERKKADDGDANESGDDDDDGVEGDSSADNIHFEPIVQLPECVDLKTGEEDEQEIYRQRAKVYRYDGNQWKERGVGEMKILKNQEKGSYRLLLRREQVHKVAINHYITVDMKLQPLQTSETAWCWYAQDFADGEPCLDNFAVRFKNIELAKQFHDVFEDCQAKLSNSSDKDGKSSDINAAGDAPQSSENQNDNTTEPKNTPDDSNQKEDVEKTLFYKRATVLYTEESTSDQSKCMVEVKIIPEVEMNSSRLVMTTDANKQVLSHILCTEDSLTRIPKKPICELKVASSAGQEPKTFNITFSSTGAADEFDKVFKEWVSKS